MIKQNIMVNPLVDPNLRWVLSISNNYCDGKFSEDFLTCTKIVENAQINNHSKYTEIYMAPEREKQRARERFYFNSKELQIKISGFMITGVLGFL